MRQYTSQHAPAAQAFLHIDVTSAHLMDLQEYIEGLPDQMKGKPRTERAQLKEKYVAAVREYNSRRAFRCYSETI